MVQWTVSDVRRLLDDPTLKAVPPGVAEMARALVSYFAVVAFHPRAPERCIKLAAEVVTSVHAADHSRGKPPLLPDSRSATTIACLNVLEQAFSGRALFPADAQEAMTAILGHLHRSIPAAKLPRGLRTPSPVMLKRATQFLSTMRITTTRHAGGRGGATFTPRGAAKRFASLFGVKLPK